MGVMAFMGEYPAHLRHWDDVVEGSERLDTIMYGYLIIFFFWQDKNAGELATDYMSVVPVATSDAEIDANIGGLNEQVQHSTLPVGYCHDSLLLPPHC